MKQEKNGFTLIELLAVIVVLAVLILFAMPTVTSQTEKGKRNIFANEAGEIITVAEVAYQELSMSGASYTKTCLPIRGLVANGDLKKSVGNLTENTAYQGSVLIDLSTGVASYHVWLENGSYTLNSGGTGFSRKNVNAVSTPGTYSQGVNTCGGQGTIPDVLQKDVRYTTGDDGKTVVTPYNCTWTSNPKTCTTR